jgi:hypothetical protein
MVLPHKEISKQEETILKNTMNLHVLTYDKTSSHIKLVEAIKDLANLAETERMEIAKNNNW